MKKKSASQPLSLSVEASENKQHAHFSVAESNRMDRGRAHIVIFINLLRQLSTTLCELGYRHESGVLATVASDLQQRTIVPVVVQATSARKR